MNLKDLDLLLKFSIQQKQDFDTWNDLTKALSSVYASVHLESNGLFYIHPETADVVEINGQGWKKCVYARVVGLQLKSRRKFRSMPLLRKVEYMIVVVSAESAINSFFL